MMNRLNLWRQRLLLDNFIVNWAKRQALMVMLGPINFQALSAAVQFDLFTLLAEEGPLRRSQIAERLRISDKSARNLLTILVAVNVLKKDRFGDSNDPVYRNTFLAKHYLNRSSPLEITNIVNLYHFIEYKAMYHYFSALKTGRNEGLVEISGAEPSLDQRLAHHPDLETIFQNAMRQLSSMANKWLAEYVDFSSARRVVDIGGGDGSNLAEVVTRNPHLTGIVFDTRTVAEKAAVNLARHGLADRIDVVAGDCFADRFPAADTVLFCHFLHLWSEEQGDLLLRKAHEQLPAGGQVVIFDIMEWDGGNGPLAAVTTSAHFLTQATGSGYMYAAREYEAWLRRVGFTSIARRKFPDEHVAVIARK